MKVYHDGDLHRGQRSSEVRCGNLCALVTKLGQVTSDELYGDQKSSEFKCGELCAIIVIKLGQKNS